MAKSRTVGPNSFRRSRKQDLRAEFIRPQPAQETLGAGSSIRPIDAHCSDALNRWVKTPDSLRVELGPSRLAAAFIFGSHIATAALLAFTPGNSLLRAAAVVAIGAHAMHALRSFALQSAPRAVVAVELSDDRQAVLVERSGRRYEGRLRPQSYVGERVTTLVVRRQGARASRAIAILPDMLPAEDLRRLRVLMRYGRAS